jgi:hypothetical protein
MIFWVIVGEVAKKRLCLEELPKTSSKQYHSLLD